MTLESEVLEEVQYYSNLISYNVIRYRRKLGLTQKALGDKSGLSRRTIANMENYKYYEVPVRMETLVKLAKGLNVLPWQLMLAKNIKNPK